MKNILVQNNKSILNFIVKNTAYIIICVFLLLATVRGGLVVYADVSPELLYPLVSISMIFISIFGYLIRCPLKDDEMLLKLFKFNLLLGIGYCIGELILSRMPSYETLYCFVAPYIVYVFMQIPRAYIETTLKIISALISISLILNYLDSLDGIIGYYKLMSYGSKLRPNKFVVLHHTGQIFRASGFTGNFHDSANLLGLTSAFFFINFIQENKIISFVLFLLGFFASTLTHSATNLVVLVFTIVMMGGILTKITSKKHVWLIFLVMIAITIGGVIIFSTTFGVFLRRIGGDGDWRGMFKMLDPDTLINTFPYIFLGHINAFAGGFKSEIAFLKILYEFGVLGAFFFFTVLTYPIYLFYKKKINNKQLAPLAAIIFGFFSLLHYGSVLRITSVFVFFAIYSLSLRELKITEDTN